MSHKVKTFQAMKFGQLIYYNQRNYIIKKHAQNKAGKLVPDLFFFFEKALYEVKASVLQFQYISIALNLAYNKNKLSKTLEY